MKNRMIIVGALVLLLVIAGGSIILKSAGSKKMAIGTSPAAKQAALKSSAKKPISKGMSLFTLKLLNSNNKEVYLRARAFSCVDSRSSMYYAAIITNRPSEIAPGTYDIEVDTVPQVMYKNINVSKGKENVYDAGVLGSINVKALNAQKKDASFAVRLMYANINQSIAGVITNKPADIMSGTYDLEINTIPLQYKKGVKIESGKECVVDLGCVTGRIVVRSFNENKKEVKYPVRIRRADKNDIVMSGSSNKAIELVAGTYNVEFLGNPMQTKNGIEVKAGEDIAVDFEAKQPIDAKAEQTQPAKAKK